MQLGGNWRGATDSQHLRKLDHHLRSPNHHLDHSSRPGMKGWYVIGEKGKMGATSKDEGVDDQKSSYGRGGRWNNAQGRLCSWEGRSLRSPNNARLLLRATPPTESGKAKKTMWRREWEHLDARWPVRHGGGSPAGADCPPLSRWESGGQSEPLLAFYSAYFTRTNLGRLPTKDQPLVILSGGGRPILIRGVLLLLPS